MAFTWTGWRSLRRSGGGGRRAGDGAAGRRGAQGGEKDGKGGAQCNGGSTTTATAVSACAWMEEKEGREKRRGERFYLLDDVTGFLFSEETDGLCRQFSERSIPVIDLDDGQVIDERLSVLFEPDSSSR